MWLRQEWQALALIGGALSAGMSITAFAQTVSFKPDANGATSFVLPSRNIECIFIPEGGTTVYKSKDGGAELSCDRAQSSYVRIQLGAKGAAQIIRKVGDPSCCGAANVLDYGKSWAMGPFTCQASEKSLSCRRADGKGFELSRSLAKAL